MSLYPPPSQPAIARGPTEFEILRASHKFLREDEGQSASWDDQLASKYYNSLFREYAVCDLKHYKSGNLSLRWRTEEEVLSGSGETSCGNTRCEHHHSARGEIGLTTLELPFAYAEHGENKSALVKAVLCPKCVKKLMWKRRRDKELLAEAAAAAASDVRVQDAKDEHSGEEEGPTLPPSVGAENLQDPGDASNEGKTGKGARQNHSHRRRSSRSLSPRPPRNRERARNRSPRR